MLSLKRDPTLQLTIGIFWVFFRHRTLIVSEAPPYNLNILVFEIFCVLFRHCTLTYCPVRYRTKEEVEKVFEQNVHRVLCPSNICCQFMTKIFSFKRIIWMRPHCTSRINQIKSSYLTEPASRKAKPHWEEKDFLANLNVVFCNFSFDLHEEDEDGDDNEEEMVGVFWEDFQIHVQNLRMIFWCANTAVK